MCLSSFYGLRRYTSFVFNLLIAFGLCSISVAMEVEEAEALVEAPVVSVSWDADYEEYVALRVMVAQARDSVFESTGTREEKSIAWNSWKYKHSVEMSRLSELAGSVEEAATQVFPDNGKGTTWHEARELYDLKTELKGNRGLWIAGKMPRTPEHAQALGHWKDADLKKLERIQKLRSRMAERKAAQAVSE
jgi:hypothetical protein